MTRWHRRPREHCMANAEGSRASRLSPAGDRRQSVTGSSAFSFAFSSTSQPSSQAAAQRVTPLLEPALPLAKPLAFASSISRTHARLHALELNSDPLAGRFLFLTSRCSVGSGRRHTRLPKTMGSSPGHARGLMDIDIRRADPPAPGLGATGTIGEHDLPAVRALVDELSLLAVDFWAGHGGFLRPGERKHRDSSE